MRAFEPDPSLRWLICVVHPDDEIGLAAWARRLVQSGATVHMAWTHATPIREAEARRAAALIGIPPGRLWFLEGTDGAIPEEMAALLPRFQALMQIVRPDRVACPAFEQGHLDHDATNWLVAQTFQGPIFEFPLYHTYLSKFPRPYQFAAPAGEETLALTRDEIRWKDVFSRSYPSQRIYMVLSLYRTLYALRGRRVFAYERLRLQGRLRYDVPNLPERMAAKVAASGKWSRWMRALDAMAPPLAPPGARGDEHDVTA